MRVDLFDFDLPPENVALRPASPRDAARLLLVPGAGDFTDATVRDLPDLPRAVATFEKIGLLMGGAEPGHVHDHATEPA